MATFSDLINTDKPVLIDFFAEWCGPCKTMKPILEQLKKEVGGKVSIIKIDIDKNNTTASSYNVQSVPTLMLFKNGKVAWRHSGVAQVAELKLVIAANS